MLDLFFSTTLTGDERYGPYIYIVFAVKTYKIAYSNSSYGISSNEISYRTEFGSLIFTMKTTGHKIWTDREETFIWRWLCHQNFWYMIDLGRMSTCWLHAEAYSEYC